MGAAFDPLASAGGASFLVFYVNFCFSLRSGEYRFKTSFASSTVYGFRMTGFVPGFGSSDFGLRVFLVMA